jgi:membrane protease YdiL (CAAX protease family)
MSTQPLPRQAPLVSVVLHLVPGIAIAAIGGIAAYLLRDAGVPAYFLLEMAVLLVMIPVMTGILLRWRRREGVSSVRDLLLRPQRSIRVWEYVVYPVIIAGFAGAVFTLVGDPINGFFRQLLVPRLPPWADIGHVFTNPEAYTRQWVVATWAVGIVTVTVAGPIMEEVYFRGFLLPRIPGPPAVVIAAGVILFALYHVFTIWMVPVRVIALIPLIVIVWRTRSVAIGILGHCLLNLVGDTLGSLPVVFG